MELRPINYPQALEQDFDAVVHVVPPRVAPEFRIPLREVVACHIETKRVAEARKSPPCQDCGAKTKKQAGDLCNTMSDDCHGCELFPIE